MSLIHEGAGVEYVLKVAGPLVKEAEAAGFPEKWWKDRADLPEGEWNVRSHGGARPTVIDFRGSRVAERMECKHEMHHRRCAQCEEDKREADRYDRSKDEALILAAATYVEYTMTLQEPVPQPYTDFISALQLALERAAST